MAIEDDMMDWLEHGVSQGWISGSVCATHDGIPDTSEEEAVWEDGGDPCQHVVRLWPEGAGRGA